MPGFLILDIDGGHYTLLPANTGRAGLIVQPPRSWDDDKPFQPSTAEAQGRAFRDKLSSYGIPAAPLVIAIGRDRLVLKEIKFPSVPAHEEPGVVRFQALKELTDAGDDVVIDYQPRGEAGGGDKRALVVALKRDVLRAAQAFAQAAGLKLTAVVPRAYGIMAAVQAAAKSSDPVAAMAIGTQGGEFLVARGNQLLFNRAIAGPALASDAALLSEVRRNLAVHNSQSPQSPVSAVYIAEGPVPAGAAAKLRETLAVPVHPLNPLASLNVAGGTPGESAAAVGVAHLLQAGGELPINFVKPRKPKPPIDPARRPLMIAAAIAAAVVFGLAILAYWQISSKDKLLQQMAFERNDLDAQLATLEPDKRRAKALDDWLNSEVVWLDELYDLAARFPEVSKLRLVQLNADPVPVAGRSKYVGRIFLKGLATSDPKPLEHLTKELVAEGTYRVEPKSQSANTLGVERTSFPLQFTMRFDVKRPAAEPIHAHIQRRAAAQAKQQRRIQLHQHPGGTMTTRERTLALVLFPPLVLVGGGFLIYQLWLEPLSTRDRQIAALNKELTERRDTVQQIVDKKRDLEKFRTISLPADADLARREYEEQLSKLMRQSGFEAGTFSVVPKPVDTKTSPAQLNKKPIYSRLIFTVQAKGDLLSFVDFLEKFYQLPLLHQVHNISVQRPLSGANRNNDLDINLTIEALVLDNAEPRKTLLPEKKPDLPSLLAGGPRKYLSIAGKDMFFGPRAAVVATTTPVRKSDINYADHIKFVSVIDGEKGPEASFYDAINSQEYLIRPRPKGDGFDVDVSYFLGGRRRPLRNGHSIEVLDENGELQHRWLVARFGERDMYLQDENDYFSLHVGQRLSDMTKLKAEEAQALGLVPAKKPVEEKKK